ncbi:archaeosortase C [Methanosarcina sp.]|uniref:archaeosortase C n=1 Tax=Methanosarcina sp. TaxID=2213 RepID=UPI003C76702E
MVNENRNLVLILLVLAMFTGMTIQFNEGSMPVGFLMLLGSLFLLTRINFKDLSDSGLPEVSKIRLILGIFIVLADLYWNFKTGSGFGTLDIMTIFFGLSLVGTQFSSIDIVRVSRFGTYISSIFVVLYLIFYTLFAFLDIDFMSNFDHYFILLPTVWVLGLAGIPLEVIATETLRINGVEDMILTIGGPCSGLYSMFLLIGIVFGYSRVKKMEFDTTLKMLGLCIAIAYVSNLFRVIILYLTAYLYGQETMMIVHTHIGWIIFAGVAAFIIYFIDCRK